MFEKLLKKEPKHDDDMTVWVPKGVYNSVEPLWDSRYAWHPIPVDDSLPMDQTSFLQIDNTEDDSEAQQAATASSSESLAPEPATDTASIHSAVSTLGELPDIKSSRPGLSTLARKSSFGFPVRQNTWNTSRRKRAAQLQRQKSRDKYGVPNKVALAQTSGPTTNDKKDTSDEAKKSLDSGGRQSSGVADLSMNADFVMFAL